MYIYNVEQPSPAKPAPPITALSTHAGVRWAAACAGIDVTSFWAKRGYCADACLPPEAWALLVDGFGNSRVMSKEI